MEINDSVEIIDDVKKHKPSRKEIAIAFCNTTDGIINHKGRTLVYDGTRYAVATDLAKQVRRFLMDNKVSHTNNDVSNTIADIEAMANRRASKFDALPFYMGSEPFPQNIIAFKNGLLNVDAALKGDAVLLPHTMFYASTNCLPYDFDHSAQCPQWMAFLNEVYEGDTARIELQQEWFGYTLLPDVSQQKIMVKYGLPRSGKGTIDRVQQAMLGDDNTTGYTLHSLADKFGLSRLIGKSLAFVGEVNLVQSREKYRILETLNSIVGGDPIAIEGKYSAEVASYKLPTRFSLSCNELPKFVDPSGALAARLMILNHEVSWVGKEDRHLESKLVSEVSGVCNWALEGLLRLRKQGMFTEPEACRQLRMKFRRNSSYTYGFVQDCLAVHETMGTLDGVSTVGGNVDECSISSDDLWNAYVEWSEGCCSENLIHLSEHLSVMMPKMTVSRPRVGGKRIRQYNGIQLKA